jgi:hypothetical protein
MELYARSRTPRKLRTAGDFDSSDGGKATEWRAAKSSSTFFGGGEGGTKEKRREGKRQTAAGIVRRN